jgi:hypothetical protein
MAESPQPNDERERESLAGRARPRYLGVSLAAALVLGAGCWTEGCARLELYRASESASSRLHAAIRDPEDRARLDALYQRLLEIADGARGRAAPLGAATFVLGAALLAIGSRGLAGRPGARRALVQVVSVQAVVVLASWLSTSDLRHAELEWDHERRAAIQRATSSPAWVERLGPFMQARWQYGAPTWLALRSIASALVIVALTRSRTREFFEAGPPLSER